MDRDRSLSFFYTLTCATISLQNNHLKTRKEMATNPVITTLPEYVDQHRDGLVAQAVIGAKTTSIINFQGGVKGIAAINILNTDVEFGDGGSCGWNPAGSQELTQRKITTGYIKINMPYCDKKLYKTYAEYGVRVAAGQKTLTFEEDFINGVIDNVKAAIEKAVWQGDLASENANLNKFDGFVKILNGAEGVIKADGAKSDVFAALQSVIEKLPATALKDDTRIFVGQDTFMKLVNQLVNKNLYHYSGENADFELVLPGTTIKVTAVGGLDGTDKIVAGRASNFYYGTDFEGDEEKFEFFYDQSNREFRLVVEFNAGVQVAFPKEVVLLTLA